MDRAQVAHHWFEEEYVPVVDLLREGHLVADGETETEAYLRVAADRYRALRTHEWSDEVLEELQRLERRRKWRRRAPPQKRRRWR
jgi:hypothetical protein